VNELGIAKTEPIHRKTRMGNVERTTDKRQSVALHRGLEIGTRGEEIFSRFPESRDGLDVYTDQGNADGTVGQI
jgi:hypothetical protein